MVGVLQQHLDRPDGNTYLGSGKIEELIAKVEATAADTVIVDSELTPRQLRNLSRQLGGGIRLCDRTALILDIFKTRALSREGQLQVRRQNISAIYLQRLCLSLPVFSMVLPSCNFEDSLTHDAGGVCIYGVSAPQTDKDVDASGKTGWR